MLILTGLSNSQFMTAFLHATRQMHFFRIEYVVLLFRTHFLSALYEGMRLWKESACQMSERLPVYSLQRVSNYIC